MPGPPQPMPATAPAPSPKSQPFPALVPQAAEQDMQRLADQAAFFKALDRGEDLAYDKKRDEDRVYENTPKRGKLATAWTDMMSRTTVGALGATADYFARRGPDDSDGGIALGTAVGVAQGYTGGLLNPVLGLASIARDPFAGPPGKRMAAVSEGLNSSSNLVGELAGALTPGGIPARVGIAGVKGINALTQYGAGLFKNNMVTRALGMGVVGAGESAAYSVATQQGNPHVAALYGFGAGAVGTLAAEAVFDHGVKYVARKAGLRDPDNTAAIAVRDSIRQNDGDAFMEVLPSGVLGINAEAIAETAKLLDLPPGAVLADLMPHRVKGQIDDLMAQTDTKRIDAVEPLRTMLRNRYESAQEGPRRTMVEVFGSSTVQSPISMHAASRAKFEELTPQYDRALRANVKNVTPVVALHRMLNRGFVRPGGGKPKTPRALAMYGELKNNLLGAARTSPKPHTKGPQAGKPRKGIERTYAPSDLLDLRKQLDSLMTGSARDGSAFSNMSSQEKAEVVTMLLPLRARLNKRLHQVAPELKDIDASFGGVSMTQNAYQAGRDAYLKADTDSLPFDIFVTSTSKSASEHAAFQEGVKSALYDATRNKSPAQLAAMFSDESASLGRLNEVFEPKMVRSMQKALRDYSRQAEVADMYKPTATAPSRPWNPWGALSDSVMIAAGSVGAMSNAIAAGAFRRQLPRASIKGLAGVDANRANFLSSPAGEAVDKMNVSLTNASQAPNMRPGIAGGSSPLAAYMGSMVGPSEAMLLDQMNFGQNIPLKGE